MGMSPRASRSLTPLWRASPRHARRTIAPCNRLSLAGGLSLSAVSLHPRATTGATLGVVVHAAPRIDFRLIGGIARLDDPRHPIAETNRRIGRLAEDLRLPAPSYEQVRVLVHQHRRTPLAPGRIVLELTISVVIRRARLPLARQSRWRARISLLLAALSRRRARAQNRGGRTASGRRRPHRRPRV